MSKRPKDYNNIDFSDGSSDIPAKPIKRTRKKLQLQQGIQFQQLQQQFLIPGITFIEKTKRESIGTNQIIHIENLNVDDHILLRTEEFLQIVKLFDYYIGINTDQNVKLEFDFLIYNIPQIKETPLSEQIQELANNQQQVKAVEVLLYVMKDKPNESLLNETTSYIDIICFDLNGVQNDDQERLALINALLTLLKLHSEVSNTYNSNVLQKIKEICHQLTLDDEIEITNYIDSNIIICELHLLEYAKYNKEDTNHNQHNLKLKQILIQCFYYLEYLLKTVLKESCNLFEEKLNKILLTLPYYFVLAEHNYRVNKTFSMEGSFGRFNIVISTIMTILIGQYYINNNQSPLTGKQMSFKGVYEKSVLQPFNKQNYKILSEEFNYDPEYNKDLEMILQTVNTSFDKSAISDSDTNESSSRYNQLRTHTSKLEIDPNTLIPKQVYQKIISEQSIISNITGVLLKNNDMILQIILQLRHYISIDNFEKYFVDLFMINHHKQVTKLLSDQQTDNTLQNTTLKLDQDSKIIDCYIYSQFENIVHTYITLLRQSNQSYLTQYKYKQILIQALNNSTYQLPNSKYVQQCGLNILKQSLKLDVSQSQIEKAKNFITQSQINENLGEWTQAVDNLIDVLNLELYNQADISLKIAQLLFNHSEYQFAQFFYCYAIKLTTKSPVICDEKAMTNTNQAKNSQHSQFYVAIKNNDLEEKMKQRSQSSTCFSDSSISNHDMPRLNQQAIDIYFKRVDCYIKIKQYSKAIKILTMLLQDNKLHKQQKISILFKLNSINVLFISNTILQDVNNFQMLYDLLQHQFEHEQSMCGSIIQHILLFAQFYFRTNRYLESLYLIMVATKLQDKIQRQYQSNQWQQEVKQYGNQQILLYWLQSILGISQLNTHQFITQLNPKLNVPNKQFQFSFNFIMDYLKNDDQEQEDEGDGMFFITETKDGLTCSQQQLEQCQILYFQLLIYLIQNMEYDIYRDERQNVTSYIMYHVSFIINSQEILQQHFAAMLSKQINFQKIIIRKSENGIELGFQYSLTPIITFQNTMQFKNYILKEVYILLQYATDIEIKLDVLLSYIQFCLLEQMQVADISQILENVVQAVYSIYMCGHHTIMSFFDFNIQQIIKVKQIYQQIIIICFQITPRPAYTQLFLDALYQIDMVIQNITQRKIYPVSLDLNESYDQIDEQLEAFLDINFKNLSTNILKYVSTGRKGPPKSPKSKSTTHDPNKGEQATLRRQQSSYISGIYKTPSETQLEVIEYNFSTALSCEKITDLGTDQFAKLMYQSLNHKDYLYLANYQEYYNQNKSDFGQESQQFQQLQYTESVMQYEWFILHLVLTNNNYSSDQCLTRSMIQLTDIVIRQYKVQEIVNAADVVRQVISEIFEFEFNIPLYAYIDKYYSILPKYDVYQYVLIRNYIYCIQQSSDPIHGIMLVDDPSLNNNIYKNSYQVTKNQQMITINGKEHKVSPINTTMWYFDQNICYYMNGLFKLDLEQSSVPQSNMMKKAMLDQLQNLFKINPMQYNIGQNVEDNQIFDMNEPFLNDDKQQIPQQLSNDSTFKSQKGTNFDPKNTFLIYIQQMDKLYNSKIQKECSKLLLPEKILISSIYLICLPYEQLFNQHLNRFTTMFDLQSWDRQRLEQQAFYKNVINGISDAYYEIKEKIQNKSASESQKLQLTALETKTKNVQLKKNLQQLSQYATQVNFQYTIQQVHFSHFIEARGKAKSSSQEARFRQIKSLAQHMLLIEENIEAESTDQADIMPEYLEQDDLYSNNTGILLPFHSQLLKIGMKKITQQVKKSVGSMTQLIDVSDYICNNELQFVFKDIAQPKDISYIMSGYKQFENQSSEHTNRPIKKSKSILQFNHYIASSEYYNLYCFIKEKCQFSNDNQENTAKYIMLDLDGLLYQNKLIQHQLLIVTFQDIISQTDLICLAHNRIKILIVPVEYIIRTATFINRINQYLIENVGEHSWNSTIGRLIYGNIEILLNLIAFTLRREYKIPVILFQ